MFGAPSHKVVGVCAARRLTGRCACLHQPDVLQLAWCHTAAPIRGGKSARAGTGERSTEKARAQMAGRVARDYSGECERAAERDSATSMTLGCVAVGQGLVRARLCFKKLSPGFFVFERAALSGERAAKVRGQGDCCRHYLVHEECVWLLARGPVSRTHPTSIARSAKSFIACKAAQRPLPIPSLA